MLSLKVGIEDLKQAKTLMSEANHIMSDHVSKLKALEEENEQLRSELGALQIQSDASYMKLPLDADGKPIRIGDTVYTRDAEEYIVRGIYALADGYSISVVPLSRTCFLPMKPEGLTHKKPEPPDSWEKLEQDVNLSIDDYWTDVLGREYTFCTGDKVTAKASDIIRRAKKLADTEQEAE